MILLIAGDIKELCRIVGIIRAQHMPRHNAIHSPHLNVHKNNIEYAALLQRLDKPLCRKVNRHINLFGKTLTVIQNQALHQPRRARVIVANGDMNHRFTHFPDVLLYYTFIP
ncbi:hypothetical protein D3C79_985510 [compost metagenome]